VLRLAALVTVALLISCGGSQKSAKDKDKNKVSHTALDSPVELSPVPFALKETATSWTWAEPQLDVVYMDLHEDIGLIFRSSVNTLVLADRDGNGVFDPGIDRGYGVDLDSSKLCAFDAGAYDGGCQGGSPLSSGGRGAAKTSENSDKRYEVSMRIPKSELLGDEGNGLIVLELFQPGFSSHDMRLPGGEPGGSAATPFKREFHLLAAKDSTETIPANWPSSATQKPADSRPAPIVPPRPSPFQFTSDCRETVANGRCQLTWVAPPDALKVDLIPGHPGANPPVYVQPDATTKYTLQVTRSDGTRAESFYEIRVPSLRITSFWVSPKTVRYGDSFSLHWDVQGATEIRLSMLTGQNTSTEVKLRNADTSTYQATRSAFPAPGVQTLTLTASNNKGSEVATTHITVIE